MTDTNSQTERYRIADLYFDARARRLSRNGTPIELPKLSFDLLLELARAAPDVVSIDELSSRVWRDVVVSDETVTQRAKILRDVLSSDGNTQQYIETVRSVGYRIGPEVIRVDSEKPVSTTSDRTRRGWITVAVVFVIAIIIGKFVFEDRRVEDASIAVLPFIALSDGDDDEYFADGVTEEVLNALAQIPDFLVTARTSAFYFKNRNVPIDEIADQLGVANILEGSVRRDHDRLRITAQLVRAEDGFHLWSETFDYASNDIFAVQTAIAENVATALELVLDEAQLAKMRSAGVQDPRAFIEYQKGLALFALAHGSNQGIELLTEANVHFEKVIARAPQFSDAYVNHADFYSHVLLSIASGEPIAGFTIDDIPNVGQHFLQDFDAAIRNAKDSQHRELFALDKTIFSGDWRGLDERIEAVLEQPICTNSKWLETVALPLGYAAASKPLVERWVKCDPLNFEAHIHLVRLLFWLGDFDGAFDAANRALQLTDHPMLRIAQMLSLLGQDRTADARTLIDSRPDDFVLQIGGNFWYAAATGDADMALGYLQQADDVFAISPGDRMAYLALIGDRDAVNEIARTADAHSFGHTVLLNALLVCYCGATFDLEETPNFARLVDEAGLQWPPTGTFNWPLKTW